jgi:uncharacterized membrane protein (DUF4010 family)
MSDLLTPLDTARHAGLALAMAIFMGLAFEGVYKREERTSPGGIRTFPLLAALGTVLYLIDEKSLLPYVVGLASVALWLHAYLRSSPPEGAARPGLMIPTANLLAYAFGAVAFTQRAWVVIAAAVAAVLLLEGREALHRLVQRVPSEEVFTLGKFLILIGIVLPLLPNHAVVDWTPITPFDAGLALVAISALSYASYLLQRYLPKGSRSLLPAILGGAYSSTATTVALAREHKTSAGTASAVPTGIIVATAVMYLRIAAIVALFNSALAIALLPALLGLCALAAVLATWQWATRSSFPGGAGARLAAINPLQLGAAATFAALFIVLAVLSSWVQAAFGRHGVYALAAIAGVTDIDPFVLSLTEGSVAGMPVREIGGAILIAASSNNVLKACYALAFGGARGLVRPALLLLVLGAAGFAVAFRFYR